LKWKTRYYKISDRTSAGFLIIAAAKAANAHDLIAHRLSTLRHADRLVVLDEGAVAEVGTHIELLRKKGIYYKLVMAQRQSSKLAETLA